ncbi:MAG TPA: hypothetical protein VHU86_00235 [Solirubrobacterales bacterium]|jgi:hypothetical protein|nr:hypothetical protein [Solirubrobacterales bacterium]
MATLRLTACLLAMLGAAACLSACGGGGETAASSSQPTPPTTSGAHEARRAEYEKARYGSPSSRSAPFARYSGKGQVHLHLAEFGAEADAGARSEAQTTITAYLANAQAGEWEAACAYLTKEVKAQLRATAGPDGPQGCPAQLRATVAGAEKTNQGSLVSTKGGIASLRVQQEAGFALFHGADGADYWMAMKVEDGAWKVLSAVPQSFG